MPRVKRPGRRWRCSRPCYSVWYDLSDVKLAKALEDRASFRRFCGFSGTEATLERTGFVRFRKALIARGLDSLLFETVTAQLKAKAVTVKIGTLDNATIIASSGEEAQRMRVGSRALSLMAPCQAGSALRWIERLHADPAFP
jgi:IS5 family transposase